MRVALFLTILAGFPVFFTNHKTVAPSALLRVPNLNVFSSAVAPAVQVNMRVKLKWMQTFEGYHKAYFSPDGTLLALMDREHIDVIDFASSQRVYRIERPHCNFLFLKFSRDGGTLAASYQDRSAQPTTVRVALWNASSGKEKLTIPVADQDWGREADVSFSPDGRQIATNLGGIARLWESDTGYETRRFLPPPELSDLRPKRMLLSPNGKWLVVDFRRFTPPTFYDAVEVWDLETGSEISVATNVYSDWRFSEDSEILAITASIDQGKITERALAEFWETRSWTRKQVIEVPGPWKGAFALSVSASGDIAAIGGRKMFGVFSIAQGGLLAERQHPEGVFDVPLYYDLDHLDFSPNGRFLVTGGEDGTVKVWRIKLRPI